VLFLEPGSALCVRQAKARDKGTGVVLITHIVQHASETPSLCTSWAVDWVRLIDLAEMQLMRLMAGQTEVLGELKSDAPAPS
jgi:hypothetical protein